MLLECKGISAEVSLETHIWESVVPPANPYTTIVLCSDAGVGGMTGHAQRGTMLSTLPQESIFKATLADISVQNKHLVVQEVQYIPSTIFSFHDSCFKKK